MLINILLVIQTVAAIGLILVGSLVEAYGYGLSLGTNWPYHQNIFGLAMKGDPEAWHRIIATTLGVNAVLLAVLAHDSNTFSGLALIAATALLGQPPSTSSPARLPHFCTGCMDSSPTGHSCAIFRSSSHRPRPFGISWKA